MLFKGVNFNENILQNDIYWSKSEKLLNFLGGKFLKEKFLRKEPKIF